jgi:ABC-type polysaccharide/polyol phosphate transport system ATPase subunit
MSAAIDVVNISKVYRRYARRKQFATLKSALLSGSLIGDLTPDETFPALRGVSFSVPKGCTYGVIGRNGSGKSTLLKCVAGISRPTEGTVTVDGRISALIELGAGFHPEISGRENIFINGIMLGLSKREVQRRFDEIVEFAEMQEFIDAPVKTYSSGMYMRLGFAVAIHVDPEVLLVDEVLAVGDQGFTLKCLDKFAEFRRRNRTILLVTHTLDLVERFCDQALWLDKGKTRAEGEPKRVVAAYIIDIERAEDQELAKAEAERVAATAKPAATAASDVGTEEAAQPDNPVEAGEEPKNMFKASEGRWGTREIEITKVALVGPDGEAGHVFQRGEPMEVRMTVKAHQVLTDFVWHRDLQCRRGLLLRNQHQPRGPSARHGHRRRRSHLFDRQLEDGGRNLSTGSRRSQARRLSVRLPPVALFVSREVAVAGRGDLQSRSSVVVQPEYSVQSAKG